MPICQYKLFTMKWNTEKQHIPFFTTVQAEGTWIVWEKGRDRQRFKFTCSFIGRVIWLWWISIIQWHCNTEVADALLSVNWGKSPTCKSASSCSFIFWATTHQIRGTYCFFSFLLHHKHVMCLPGQSCPVLSSHSRLLESCLNKVTFIHEWVSMATRPQDYLSHSPPWCDG